LQQLRVIHIKNVELRKAIQVAGFDQPQITEASDLFAIAVKKEVTAFDVEAFMNLLAQVRGVEVESLNPYKERVAGSILTLSPEKQSEWLFKQAYILLGFLLETAALLEVDACPMEGFDKASVDKILNLDKFGLNVALLIPVGYRGSDDKYEKLPKTRLSKENFIIEI
jgi:nitroreductase / dihydropteridine reductase